MAIFRRCKHAHVRCVHGDEIIARGFKRVACLDCGRSLKGGFPDFCYSTGELHPSLKPCDSETRA